MQAFLWYMHARQRGCSRTKDPADSDLLIGTQPGSCRLFSWLCRLSFNHGPNNLLQVKFHHLHCQVRFQRRLTWRIAASHSRHADVNPSPYLRMNMWGAIASFCVEVARYTLSNLVLASSRADSRLALEVGPDRLRDIGSRSGSRKVNIT